jgi:hypothetical protein
LKSAILLGALAAVAVALVPQATARENAATKVKSVKHAKAVVRPDATQLRRVLAGIHRHRKETWRWQRVMQVHRTPYSKSVRATRSLAYRKWVLELWQRRAYSARVKAQNPPHLKEWLCIHGYEGSWTDPNSPYYGGLQMDLEFQATYGPELLRTKGTADHWTPLEQIWVAERAYKTRGFWPWPNTARSCGLL